MTMETREDERVPRMAFVAVAENRRVQRAKHGDGGGSVITNLNNLGVAEERQRPDQLS